ncbi:hypothetical protein FEM48_Zijuj09G0051600 [Ziziphus jujuba var. spinosa]|uniref:Uncharacterized protein n=1 Tax=Ziziphus jujuba var. spinosa TaxID=714518 RepID=A0A978UR25_ZIZJJ|nr:hypothetical protein FEM48_Zijuj09G0051600 [Ziziphus jujuba var. spinosa]
MRFYPLVPADSKEAVGDDVLPDGTVVKKGDKVMYHSYAMGRMENIWGRDWAEYRPEWWLEWKEESKKWNLVIRDSYTYPVAVAGVLCRFRVVSTMAEGTEPVFISHLTSKMKGGFPVRFVERGGTE